MTPSSSADQLTKCRRAIFSALRVLLGLTFTLLLLWGGTAFALLVSDDGLVEPIIVQIKDSLRTSADLDSQLAQLADLENANGLTVLEWWAGPKLLVMLSFPADFTEQKALDMIGTLKGNSCVEKVVAQSAYNLEFQAGDFERSYGPDEVIPDAARRGFDVDRLSRPAFTYDFTIELPPHVENHLIVRWKDEYVWNESQSGYQQRFADFNAQAGCTVVDELQYSDHDQTQVLEFDAAQYSILDQLILYQANDMVDYVQPEYIYESQDRIPIDPIYASHQWSLPKIKAPAAWSITTGNPSVVIAVADSGANVNHPDFVTNLWSGQNNGDIHNFAYNTTNVSDDFEHGSNVASIIGAQGNNNTCMSGVAWDVSLMILKVADIFGHVDELPALKGINYASMHGATAINMSFGYSHCHHPYRDADTGQWVCDYYVPDPALVMALKNARAYGQGGLGMVAVCSAGNDGLPDTGTNTPSDIPTDNVISVAASDQNDIRPGFSNYGARGVDLAAPGVAIYGLKQDFNGNSYDLNNYSVIDGTSQAAPHVTGTIALLKSKYPWENYHGLRDRVLMGTDDIASWATYVRTGGRLNVSKALHARTVIRNLSTRARVENNDRIMIGGFTVGGSGTLKVAIRGLGPSLPNLGVAKLNNPKIQLNNSTGVVYSNNDWGTLPAGQKSDLHTAGLEPTDSREAAMVQTLAPGAYTVFVRSQDAQFGVGLFEIYELEGGRDEQCRLLNLSTRCIVGTGNERAIAGVMLGDPAHSNDTTLPKRSVLMFGKGPSLPATIPGRLANPTLALYNSPPLPALPALMTSNDSWANAIASVVRAADPSAWTNLPAAIDELTAAGFAAGSPYDSALWPILKSGGYTAILSGVSGGTGIGLIEFYEY